MSRKRLGTNVLNSKRNYLLNIVVGLATSLQKRNSAFGCKFFTHFPGDNSLSLHLTLVANQHFLYIN